MREQPFEPACRGGSLLVGESRVVRRGAAAWAVWRSQITGASCTFGDAGATATVYLHLHDGRRFTVDDVAPRECFRLFELLGYQSAPDVSAWTDGKPLVIELGDGQTRVVADAGDFALEHDRRALWRVPRDQVLGVRVIAGIEVATVQIHTRDGATALDGVSFGAALRLLVACGKTPDEALWHALHAARAASAGAKRPRVAREAETEIGTATARPQTAAVSGSATAPARATKRPRAARAASPDATAPGERKSGRKQKKDADGVDGAEAIPAEASTQRSTRAKASPATSSKPPDASPPVRKRRTTGATPPSTTPEPDQPASRRSATPRRKSAAQDRPVQVAALTPASSHSVSGAESAAPDT